MNIKIRRVLMLSVAIISFGTGGTHAPGACLEEICLDTVYLTEDEWVSRFGPGFLVNAGKIHCYKVDDSPTFIAVGAEECARNIVSVYVGSYPRSDCPTTYPSLQSIPILATAEGLALGDSAAEVLHLYSRAPGFRWGTVGAREVATFYRSDSGRSVRVAIYRGRVVSVLVETPYCCELLR
jgi:hypothetical protein